MPVYHSAGSVMIQPVYYRNPNYSVDAAHIFPYYLNTSLKARPMLRLAVRST